MRIRYKYQGFTIVELLIVIVVIAILVTISSTAYAGIQTRAKNAQILQAVASWEKALKSYKVIAGHLPVSDYNCLANDPNDFPVANGLAAGECMHGYPTFPNFSAVYSAALTADLKSVLSKDMTLPPGGLPAISGVISALQTPIYSQGIRYNNLALQYYLLGKGAGCDKGTAYMTHATDTLTFCTLDLNI